MLHNRNSRLWWEPVLPVFAVAVNLVLGYYGAYSWQCITHCPADNHFALAVACAVGSLTVLLTVPLAIGLNITFRGLPDAPDAPLDDGQVYQGPVQQPIEPDPPPGWLPIKRQQVNALQLDRVTIQVSGREVVIHITPAQFRALADLLKRKPHLSNELYQVGQPFNRAQFDSLKRELTRKGLVRINGAGWAVVDDAVRAAIIERSRSLPAFG